MHSLTLSMYLLNHSHAEIVLLDELLSSLDIVSVLCFMYYLHAYVCISHSLCTIMNQSLKSLQAVPLLLPVNIHLIILCVSCTVSEINQLVYTDTWWAACPTAC